MTAPCRQASGMAGYRSRKLRFDPDIPSESRVRPPVRQTPAIAELAVFGRGTLGRSPTSVLELHDRGSDAREEALLAAGHSFFLGHGKTTGIALPLLEDRQTIRVRQARMIEDVSR